MDWWSFAIGTGLGILLGLGVGGLALLELVTRAWHRRAGYIRGTDPDELDTGYDHYRAP